MKILHTSDWHIGHRLYEQHQLDEQLLFLNWLSDAIKDMQVDVLVVSGDIFDSSAPSSHSQKLYFDFLIGLRDTQCKHVVITAGNHDSPGVIEAPKAVLQALNVYVVGRVSDNVNDEIIQLDINGEALCVAAIPYLRDQDIRRAVAGEAFDEIEQRYRKAIANHFGAVAEAIPTDEQVFKVAMGHLFATNTQVSDSEQSIYVGNLGHIAASEFPKVFDYIALGHLHRPQRVGGQEHIRYCGAPLHYSFGEGKQIKKIVIVETNAGQLASITPIDLPVFRKLYRIDCDINDIESELLQIDATEHELTPWVEIMVDQMDAYALDINHINTFAEPLKLSILKVSFKNIKATKGIEQLVDESKQIKELSPTEVFHLKCEEQSFDLEENKAIEDAFLELLHHTKQQ